MKTNAKNLKRLLAMTLVFMLVFVPSLITAFAAGEFAYQDTQEPPYTITIVPDENSDTTNPGRFQAFQIFKGNLDKSQFAQDVGDPSASTVPTVPNTSTHEPPIQGTLSDVEWGESVDGKEAAIVEALLASDVELKAATSAGNDGVVVQDYIRDALVAAGVKFQSNESGNENYYKIDTTTSGNIQPDDARVAAAIAKALADCGTTTATNGYNSGAQDTLAKAFAKIASANVTTAYETSKQDAAGNWTLGGEGEKLAGGYYLIKDTEGTADDDSKSDLIMGVFGNEWITLKAGAPTSDKDILKDDNTTAKGDSDGISDTVRFLLTGTLPENFSSYTSYDYTFHDTLSAGLTFGDIDRVYVDIDGTLYEIEINAETGYQLLTGESAKHDSIQHSLDVKFANLKNLKGKEINKNGSEDRDEWTLGSETEITLDKNSKIYVEYHATVNENADAGDPGQRNDSYVEYPNDPNGTGHGKTTTDTVYDYEFGLDLTKVGTDPAHSTALAGAGFTLTKKVGSTTYYAVFTKNVVDGKTKYTLAGWLTEDELTQLGVPNAQETNWGDKLNNETLATVDPDWYNSETDSAKEYYVTIVSADDGKIWVEGLETGKYTLTEVVTPPGYNTMNPFNVEIVAELNPETGELIDFGGYPLDADMNRYDKAGWDAEAVTSFSNKYAVDHSAPSETLPDEGGDNPDYSAQASAYQAAYEKALEREQKGYRGFNNSNSSGFAAGLVPFELINEKSPMMPSTGGIGTTIFYIVGGLLLVGAAAYIVVSNRRKAEEKN